MDRVLFLLGIHQRSGIAGSHGDASCLTFLRNRQTAFQSGGPILHSHQHPGVYLLWKAKDVKNDSFTEGQHTRPKIIAVMDWMFVSLQNSYVEVLIPSVLVLGLRKYWRWNEIRRWGPDPTGSVCPHKKRHDREGFPLALRAQRRSCAHKEKDGSLQVGKRALSRNWLCWHPEKIKARCSASQSAILCNGTQSTLVRQLYWAIPIRVSVRFCIWEGWGRKKVELE